MPCRIGLAGSGASGDHRQLVLQRRDRRGPLQVGSAGAGVREIPVQRRPRRGIGIELDADASETHRRHVGPCLTADITVASAPHPADLVCGGVPCQSFSTAGKRAGLNDDRGQLFRALLRLAGEAGARCVALENVRGLISCGALPVILSAFRAAGYEPVHALLNACDFGVPQNRVRLFIAGFRDAADLARFRWPRPTHGAPGNLLRLPPWVTVREALGLPPVEHRTGRIDGATGWNGQRVLDPDAPSPAVTSGTNSELLSRLDRPAPTVKANIWHEGQSERASQRASGALAAEIAAASLAGRPGTTVDSTNRLSAAGHHSSNKVGAVRLTLRDCARLQAFPDDFDFVGKLGEQHRQEIGRAHV
mgnify:CR=1 FL=1